MTHSCPSSPHPHPGPSLGSAGTHGLSSQLSQAACRNCFEKGPFSRRLKDFQQKSLKGKTGRGCFQRRFGSTAFPALQPMSPHWIERWPQARLPQLRGGGELGIFSMWLKRKEQKEALIPESYLPGEDFMQPLSLGAAAELGCAGLGSQCAANTDGLSLGIFSKGFGSCRPGITWSRVLCP